MCVFVRSQVWWHGTRRSGGSLAGATRVGEARAASSRWRVECAEAASARRVERHESDTRLRVYEYKYTYCNQTVVA